MLKNLPKEIPIFPLKGVIMFPQTILPLNIFEPRYVSMIEDAIMTKHRLIGIIQPYQKNTKNLSTNIVGCLGRIISFEERNDNKYFITLKGISRFKLLSEKITKGGYFLSNITLENFILDIEKSKDEKNFAYKNDKKMKIALKNYFDLKNIETDWNYIEKCNNSDLVDQVAMSCPFTSEEKQMLLESKKLEDRYILLTSILEMNVMKKGDNNEFRH